MAMDVGGKKSGPKSDINVTPLIDVVLVLLIIFMVLTPSMLKNLPMMVPDKADDANAAAMPPDTSIMVEYTAKRELTVNGEAAAIESLATNLADRLKARRQKVVFFKAEDKAPYGEVVRLLDIARGSGAETLAIVTE